MKGGEIWTLADNVRNEVEQTAHQVSWQVLAHLLHKMITGEETMKRGEIWTLANDFRNEVEKAATPG